MQEEIDFLCQGFCCGFHLGYKGPHETKQMATNLKRNDANDRITLWNKVMKEVKLKRYAGPFEQVPFEQFVQSPIGLVPKDGGRDMHLIFHLSYPRSLTKTSINANTPQNICMVKYPEFDKVIRLCLAVGKLW